MKKLEYRCSRCLIIEERWATISVEKFNSVPCPKCGGLALRIPWSESKDKVFEDIQKNIGLNNFH
jgi:Zn finger protein HypA/HybF involved in hydrogenase expression